MSSYANDPSFYVVRFVLPNIPIKSDVFIQSQLKVTSINVHDREKL
jgi:hypothetical protein